jgi:hypothetical protein
MTYYSLLAVDTNKTLSTPARDRSEAFALFEKELGMKLALEDSDAVVACCLLDEWEVGPHWVNHHIRVFATPI